MTPTSNPSANAIKHGLFAAHDFIRESETTEHAQTFAALMEQLTPEGILEQTFATEIMSATWRLRRCRIVEANFALSTSPDQLQLDPMIDELTSKEQKSVDRARAQSHNILRRCIAELRKLQTERTLRVQLQAIELPCLTDSHQVISTIKIHDTGRLANRKAHDLDTFEGLMAHADRDLGLGLHATGANNPFCKPETAAPKTEKLTPRNALCPCRSGEKFKRCCGKDAPPQLNFAEINPAPFGNRPDAPGRAA